MSIRATTWLQIRPEVSESANGSLGRVELGFNGSTAAMGRGHGSRKLGRTSMACTPLVEVEQGDATAQAAYICREAPCIRPTLARVHRVLQDTYDLVICPSAPSYSTHTDKPVIGAARTANPWPLGWIPGYQRGSGRRVGWE